MKKIIAMLCVIAAVFTLCACGETRSPEETDNAETPEEIVAQGECFTVMKLTGRDEVVKYSYEVKSRDGEVLEHALCAEQPRVAQISKDLVGIRFTAEGHSFSRYFDIKNGRVSLSFRNAFWDNGELVAYNGYSNGHYFAVESIFGDGYSYTTTIESSSWQISVVGVEAVKNGDALDVSYVHGDGSDANAAICTVTLPLVEDQQT